MTRDEIIAEIAKDAIDCIVRAGLDRDVVTDHIIATVRAALSHPQLVPQVDLESLRGENAQNLAALDADAQQITQLTRELARVKEQLAAEETESANQKWDINRLMRILMDKDAELAKLREPVEDVEVCMETGYNLARQFISYLPADIARRQAVQLAEARKDAERLDGMQSMTKGYGHGWVLRESSSGRGMRLHETSSGTAFATVRAAIDAALKESAK